MSSLDYCDIKNHLPRNCFRTKYLKEIQFFCKKSIAEEYLKTITSTFQYVYQNMFFLDRIFRDIISSKCWSNFTSRSSNPKQSCRHFRQKLGRRRFSDFRRLVDGRRFDETLFGHFVATFCSSGRRRSGWIDPGQRTCPGNELKQCL